VSVKRLSIRIACALACTLAASLQSVAQSLPADSVVFDSVTVYAGRPAELTARFVSSHTLHILTLPLAYPADLVTLDSVIWVSERVKDLPLLTWDIDPAAGFVYLSAAATEEPFIPPGQDILARFHFTSRADAPDGVVAIVDTIAYDPEYPVTVRSTDMEDLPLYFRPGMIQIIQVNNQPAIQLQVQQYVNEGEQLEFPVSVDDLDGDPVTVGLSGAPATATFTKINDSEYSFAWTPEFAGPFSSVASPFSVSIMATDGQVSVTEEVFIWVGNVNRPPVLTHPAAVTSTVRDTVKVTIGALDLDADPLHLYTLSDFEGDAILGNNPWTFRWAPTRADIGTHEVQFVCEDDYGATDTVALAVTIESVIDHRLSIEYLEAAGGELVEVAVNLFTRDAIGAADLSINYDPSALTFQGVERTGVGMESWELFEATDNKAMIGRNVHIVAMADLDNGVVTDPLPPSDTVLFNLKFLVSDNAELFDQSISLTFPLISDTDNILSLENGDSVFHEDIEYSPGGILIKQPEGFLIGDINLNGVAFEIGDAVRLMNYFVSGKLLDPVQRANSDCNQDGVPATISDMVFLINTIAE